MNAVETSQGAIRIFAENLKYLVFPPLTRPLVPQGEPATQELVSWAIRAYSYPWIRHFATLMAAIATLEDAGNKPAIRIVGRSSFELCAHAYYVKKHVKQHLDARDLQSVWQFLTPVATGSRYMNTQFPEESALFPLSAHISKVVNCFAETMPQNDDDDYSYLSEYSHPNTMAFLQYYRWKTPDTIVIEDASVFGAFGVVASSGIRGLMAIEELLGFAGEREIRGEIRQGLMVLLGEASSR